MVNQSDKRSFKISRLHFSIFFYGISQCDVQHDIFIILNILVTVFFASENTFIFTDSKTKSVLKKKKTFCELKKIIINGKFSIPSDNNNGFFKRFHKKLNYFSS